jgi:tetratricopeptide (TPR) repeat protein
VDPTIILPAVGTREPHAVEPRVQSMTDDLVIVGDIPATRLGLQPRPALLARLNQASQGTPVVLTGPRGAGKTQLAAAYARAKLAARWRLVAWVNARDSLTLLAGLAAVADATGLSVGGSRPGPADAGEAVRDWLEADGSLRLLVFDDVEDPGLLRPFLPAAGEAQVLIIAARQPMAELGTNVPVDVFSADEALALLGERTVLADEDGALAVAVQLGYLPLALDQAAGMIAKQQHMGYAAYLAKLRALSAEDHLAREDEAEEQQSLPPGVAEAVLLAMEAASYADRLGVSIGVMELVAMLSPAVVRRDLLRSAGQAGTLLGGGRRVAASMVDQALERLNERSLLGFSLDGQVVSVHRLAAQVIRAGLARQGRFVTACRTAASAVDGSSAVLAKHRTRAAITEMAGQVAALAQNAGAVPDDAGELATMLARLRSLVLNHLAELGEAMPEVIATGEPLAADLYRLLGPDDPDTIRTRTDLARAYHQTGRVGDAIPLVEQVLAARERLFGADHPGTLASRNNLASAYRATGRAAEAIPLFEKNVAACERLFGSDHQKTLASRHSLDLACEESAQAGRGT